jgi:nucleotide-binding universal stress UspA family protein
MISHILVPLDGSELAEGVLPYAKDLGSRLHAKVHFLQVFEGEMPELWESGSAGMVALEAAAEQTERKEITAGNYLSQLVSSWRAEGIDAESTVVKGAPAVKIIETARSLGVDLIAMSTHGRSGLGRLVSGSVADEVVREAGIAVLLVTPPHDMPAETPDAAAS